MQAEVAQDELDSGPRLTRSGPARMCALTRQVRPVEEMIRFVVSPSGAVAADIKRKLPGRGLWLTASHQSVADAVRRGVFPRGFKRAVAVSPALPQEVDALLLLGLAQALAIAGKAGAVIAGFGKVEDALARHEVAALIHASDGAADGIRRLDAAARRAGAESAAATALPVVSFLSSAELDLALGRSNVIHAALLEGGAGDTFLSRSRMLARYRMDDGTAAKAAPQVA